RLYHPETGRFTTRDPHPTPLNKYQAFNANPAEYTDPTGNISFKFRTRLQKSHDRNLRLIEAWNKKSEAHKKRMLADQQRRREESDAMIKQFAQDFNPPVNAVEPKSIPDSPRRDTPPELNRGIKIPGPWDTPKSTQEWVAISRQIDAAQVHVLKSVLKDDALYLGMAEVIHERHYDPRVQGGRPYPIPSTLPTFVDSQTAIGQKLQAGVYRELMNNRTKYADLLAVLVRMIQAEITPQDRRRIAAGLS
uniref:hypothetical protein n=1 Tax=Streptomyces sp. NRRL F-2664 TaxID=1463842 RepID=UPI0018FE8604